MTVQTSRDEPSTTTVSTGSDASPTWRFRNWSVRTKLLAIVVLPLVAAIVATTLLTQTLRTTASERQLDVELSEAQSAALDLVGQLQREQVVIASEILGVTAESENLPSRQDQEERSQAAFEVLQSKLVDIQQEFPTLVGPVQAAFTAILRVDAFRSSYAESPETAPLLSAASTYNIAVTPVFTLSNALSGLIAARGLRAQTVIINNLADANRLAVFEDVLLLGADTDTPQRPEIITELNSADDRRSAALSEFRDSATNGQQSEFNEANDQAARDRRSRNEEVNQSTGAEQSTPTEFLTLSLEAADDTTALRERLSSAQLSDAQSQRQAALTTALVITILVFALLIIGLILTFFAVRGVIRPLTALRVGALDIAGNKLPQAIARIREGGGRDTDLDVEPVDVDTVEETGQVARAFDELHREAVRLAAEQEQLRRNVNSILVNLSRRSQALVGRQLSLIDRLENQEKDPDQLSQLFRLDHLASRMRRNNDNLMVLAGAGGTQSGKPLQVVDVVRAAVSETEAYTRITVQAVPTVDVSASVANDLVHLLAELLDNATSFSPPTSRVTVAVRRTADSGLVIEVTDSGVGMGPAELTKVNQRLADTPAVDSDVPRQMGLFVVSRLARRHNVGVSLRRPESGSGLVAAVAVPVTALVGDSTSSRRPELASSFGGRKEAGGDSSVEGASSTSAGHELLGPHAGAAPAGAASANGSSPNGSVSDPQGWGAAGRAPSPTQRSAPTRREPSTPAPSRREPAEPVGLSQAPSEPTRPGASAEPTELPPTINPPSSILSPTPHPLSNGSARPAPAAEPEEMTPIFQELSAWFSGRDDVVTPATSGSSNGFGAAPATASPRPADPLGEPSGADLQPVSELEPEFTLPTFTSGADEGWQAVLAVEREAVEEVTAVGLPRRRPKANLVPGSALPTRPADNRNGKHRDPEAVRGRLSSYQRGLQSGRNESRIAAGSDGPRARGPERRPDNRPTDSRPADNRPTDSGPPGGGERPPLPRRLDADPNGNGGANANGNSSPSGNGASSSSGTPSGRGTPLPRRQPRVRPNDE